MNTEEFLARVLPEDRVLYVARLNDKTGKGFIHKTFAPGRFDLAADYIYKISATTNIWHACGGFVADKVANPRTGRMQPSRKVENVSSLKSLWIDLDCGSDKPYATKKEALTALTEKIKAKAVPRPSLVIDSGGGIHAYWVFDEAIPLGRWGPLALAFKRYVTDAGLHIDPVCTADAARVMRPVGSQNHKFEQPRSVKLIRDFGNVDVDEIERTVEHLKSAQGRVKGSIPKIMSDLGTDMAEELEAGTSGPRAPAYMEQIVKRCPAMAEVLETHGRDQEEPYWMATLHLASFCEDGREWAHELSKGYAGYSQLETDQKFDARLSVDRDRIGPTTCEGFSQFSTKCATCPHAGLIRTPLMLGGEGEVEIVPRGFKFDDGILYRLKRGEEDDMVWNQVTWFRIDRVELTTDHGFTYIAVTWRAKKGGAERVALFQLADLADDRTFARHAHNEMMSLQTAEMKDFRVCMVAFSTLLQQRTDPTKQIKPFGWGSNTTQKWFGVGDKSFIAGNKVEPVNPATGRQLIEAYKPVGSEAKWQQVCDFLCAQDHPPLITILASAFAAPLVELIGLHGLVISVMSPGSGLGKSSALRLAASVWGHPTDTVNSLDDTPAMLSKKMGITANLPAYWDELRVKRDVDAFVRHVFRVSQGKDKSRLKSDTSFNIGQSWHTLMLCCSNSSLYDFVVRDGGGEAGYYRVFEMETTPPPGGDAHKTTALFGELDTNYGHAGRIYARHLVENREAITKRLDTFRQKLTTKLNASAPERFWIGVITALLVGASEANSAGITRINTNTLAAYLIERFRELRQKDLVDATDDVRPEELLSEFFTSHMASTLVTNRLQAAVGRPKTGDQPIQMKKGPSQKLVVHIGTEDGVAVFSSKAFRNFLSEQGVPQSHVVRSLQAMGYISQKRRATLGAGTLYATPAPTQCFRTKPGAINLSSLQGGDDDALSQDT